MATDHLDEDIPYSNLRYAALSFAGTKTRQRIDKEHHVAVRIRGGFPTVDDAMAHVRKLDRSLDTYVSDMHKWVLVGNVTDDMNAEAILSDMVVAHRARNEIEKQRFEERKKRAIESSIDDLPDHLKDEITTDMAPKTEETKEETSLKDVQVIDDDPPGDDHANGVSLTDEDKIKVSDLKFVAISFVKPDPEYQKMQPPPSGVIGIKIRGIYSTRDEAEKHIKETLSKLDPDFDVLLADLYKWLMLPFEHDDDVHTTYRETYLNDLFSDYKASQDAAIGFMKSPDVEHLEKVVHPTEMKAIGASGSQ